MRHVWDPRAPDPGRLVRPVPIDPSGATGPTRHEAESRYWRPTARGLYVPADVSDDKVEQRILEQSATMPAAGAVTGWAACRLHGSGFCDGLGRDGRSRLPVPVNVGQRGSLNRTPRVRPVFRHLPPTDRASRLGIPTVTIERATYDAVLLAPDATEAVVAIDVVCAAGLMSLRMLQEYADRQRWRRAKVYEALPFASEHSRSPNETRLRRVAESRAGLPRLWVNCPVHALDGRLLGIADLLDVEAGLVIEFHGAEHRKALRHAADLQREAALRGAGLEIAGIAGRDVDDEALVVRRLLEARARARFEPILDRRWIARPPPDDLHERLVVQRVQRAQHEALEAQPLPDLRELRGYQTALTPDAAPTPLRARARDIP